MLGESVNVLLHVSEIKIKYTSEYRILKPKNICIGIGLQNLLSVGLYTQLHRNMLLSGLTGK